MPERSSGALLISGKTQQRYENNHRRRAGLDSGWTMPRASLVLAPRDADLDPPRRHFRILLFPHEVDLGSPDIGVPGKFPHLVHCGPVADGIVDGGLPQRMDADTPAAQPVGVDARGPAVLLDEPPGGLAVQLPPRQPGAVRFHGPEQRPLLVVPDARALEICPDRPRGIEQDLVALLVPLLGDVEIMLDPVGLKMPHAGLNDRRD